MFSRAQQVGNPREMPGNGSTDPALSTDSRFASYGICHIFPPGKWILFALATALLAHGLESALRV